ncbi:MAG: sodium:proton antiporter [Ichthyobacteriaceae bacterium]|nr:sodium:proton antiporter [Ichthyobacteriaceae bacterium]
MFNAFITVLFFASIFSFINAKYLKLPSTIGLMIQATILSGILFLVKEYFPDIYKYIPHFERTIDFRDFLMNVILSFLLFAGAMHVDLKELRSQKRTVFMFATLGVIISTILIGFSTYYILGWFGIEIPLLYGFLFGAIVSPTDPIAVLGILKMYNVRTDIQMKIEGESLFNDGIGIVVFISIMHMIDGGVENTSVIDIATLFLREAVGGVAFGFLMGYTGFLFMKNIQHNPKTDIMITLVIATSGYAIANMIEVSGALAMVVAGLFIGNKIHSDIFTEETKNYIHVFWDVLDEILNAILFVMIGLFALQVHTEENSSVLMLVLIIAAMLIIRFISVIIPYSLIKQDEKESNWKVISVLSWGGLRGGLSIALALSVDPENHGDLFVYIVFIIAAFSIIVQGLTIGKLVKKVGLNQK